MVYGTTLRLPGEFTVNYTVDANTDLDDYSDKLQVAMSCLWLCARHGTSQKDTFQCKKLKTCSDVFLRRIPITPPLTAPYDGPYKVVSRSGRVLEILMKGKVGTVTADCVKPAHIEREPETCSSQPRQSQHKPKFTTKMPAVIAREPRVARARSRT